MFDLTSARSPHPSKYWIAELKYRGWSLEEFSNRSGLSIERLCMPFNIDQEFADGCAKAFESSSDLWLNLQKNYRGARASIED